MQTWKIVSFIVFAVSVIGVDVCQVILKRFHASVNAAQWTKSDPALYTAIQKQTWTLRVRAFCLVVSCAVIAFAIWKAIGPWRGLS